MVKQQAVEDGTAIKVTFVLPENHKALPASVVGGMSSSSKTPPTAREKASSAPDDRCSPERFTDA
jgi:hypothetical protein